MRAALDNFFGIGKAWGATPTAAIVQSGTPDSDYPISALYDKQTSPVCKWASLGGYYYFSVSLNVIPDGDAEQAAIPSDWVASGGTLTRVAPGVPFKGTYAFALTPAGTGEALARCDVAVRAGTYWRIKAATAGNAASRIARFQVIDLERGGGYYLAANGTWTTTPTWLGSTSAAAWTSTTVAEFRAPTFAEWGRRSGFVRVVLDSPAHANTAAVYFDEILMFPSKLDVVAFVGHNFPRDCALTVYTWADYWWGGTLAAPWNASGRMLQPTGWLYSPTAPITEPYLQIRVTYPGSGTAYRYPQIGELFLGRMIAFPRSVRPGWRTEWKEDQPRQQTRGGLWTTRDLQYPVRKFPIAMDLEGGNTPEDWPAVRDEIMAASGMGADPCILLPAYDTEPDWCLFGNFVDSLGLTRSLPHQDLAWEFQEMSVPLIG